MKNFNNTSLFNFIKSKGLILISSSFLLTSCVIYTGGYSETDGVYYDPNKDSLPAGSYTGNYGNQVDDYYNYQDTYPSIYDNTQQNLQDQQNRYSLSSDSDWGSYTGSETNYTSFNNWGWGGMGFGYGGFGGWGYPNYGWGWNGGFNSFGWGMGFGWGNSFYSPWGWGGGFYDPFWGYGYGGWGGYYGNGWSNYRPAYNRSGSNGRLGGMISNNRINGFRGINSTRTSQPIAGNSIRNDIGNIRNSNGTRNINNGNIRNQNSGNIRQFPNNDGVRNTYPNNGNVRNTYPNNGGVRTSPNNGNVRTQQNNGGFRNDTYTAPTRSGGNSGGFNSGGGMRSGGNSGGGGGMRSGGGGRR